MATKDEEVPGPSKKAKCWGESIVDLQNIVKILVKDTYFIENWKQFYYSLEQPSPKFVQWDRSFRNNTMTVCEILTEMLSHWIMTLGTEAKVGRLYAALVSEGFIAVGEALTNQYDLSCKIVQMAATSFSNQSMATNPEWDIPISFDLSEPTENFVGRTTELEMLEKFYQQKTKLVVVSGLGGVGKSELVRKFGIKFRNDVRGNCIWIQGDSEESFKNSVRRLADHLSLKLESDTDIVDGFIKIHNSKLRQRPILIIVDNVDKSNSLVVKLIKGCKRLLDNVRLIIVTTRNKSVLQIEGGNIELKMLKQNEAVKMIANGLESGVSLFEATKLCATLGHFPLIVQQAISFIKQKRSDPFERNFGVPEYLKLFEKEKRKLLDSPVNDDDNYNSTTFATWGMILDNLKQTNGSTGLLAVNILRTLPYFDANGVFLSQLVKFYQNDNMPYKTCIGSQSNHSRLDFEELKGAIRLIEAYSMCRVDSGVYTGLGGDLRYYKISSHRLIRDFMLLCRDTEMDKDILRRLFFVDNKWLLNNDNVDKLGKANKTLVVEMFANFYKVDVDDGRICPSALEIYRKNFFEALETNGLYIHFALNFGDPLSLFFRCSERLLKDCITIYQYVRRRYGDHLLSRSLRPAAIKFISNQLECSKSPIDISIGFLVDVMDDRFTNRSKLMDWYRPIMESLLLGDVPIEKTNVVMELKESVINYYDFNENYNKQFTFSILTAISQFFKRKEDIDRFNEIQSDMSRLMQHPSELITIWHFINEHLDYPSSVSVQTIIFNNYADIVDDSTLSYLQNGPCSFKSCEMIKHTNNLLHESKGICYLDLFTLATIAVGGDKEDIPSDIISNKLEPYLINKDLILRVIQTMHSSVDDGTDGTDREDRLLSLYTEIPESVRNGLVNSYEGIWSLGQIYKVLWDNRAKPSQIELVDTLEGLANNERDKELVKTILCSIIDRAVWDVVNKIWHGGETYYSCVIPLFLRLQMYGLYFPMLKQILRGASVEQIETIGSNIIDNHRKGLINNADTFLAIKQVVKSFLKEEEKEKALDIICQTLNIEHLLPCDGNHKKLLLEKVQSTVVHFDDINIAIATLFYLMDCRDIDDPAIFRCPSIIVDHILRILVDKQSYTKLLALCFEIGHCVGVRSKLGLCWTFIQILRRLVEMNKNEPAERFLKRIIKKMDNSESASSKTDSSMFDSETDSAMSESETDSSMSDSESASKEVEFFCYFEACWFLVFGTYYEAQSDVNSTSHILEVDDCIKQLKTFETSIKN